MMETKQNNFIIFIMIGLAAIMVSRGLFTKQQLAGHDTAAYYINQHQFHKNIADGNLFPRWAPDMRYGYGHPKLQFRPPLLHYLAEPIYAITENPSLSINSALIILIFLAGTGMFFCCKMYMKSPFAMLGAIAYLTFNYLLADIYIRGAYYEVAAYAFMPWIIWGQSAIFKTTSKEKRKINIALPAYSIFWAALICSHPQIMVFFIPLASVHFLFTWNESRNNRAATYAIIAIFAGFAIAAPYWFVAWQELKYVRMELFYTGLESYSQHFLSIQELLFEKWPETYQQYSHIDYHNRPRHTEMRALNVWVLLVLTIIPFFWFSRNSQKSRFNRVSIMFFISFFGLITLALPISKGIWFLLYPMQTFNFPWRVLAVSAVCISILTGLLSHQILININLPEKKFFSICILASLLLIIFTWNKSTGWKSDSLQQIKPEHFNNINKMPGIPKQFYTPKWVQFYSSSPNSSPVRFLSGEGNIELIYKKTSTWNIKIKADVQSKIAIAHYYYPGWELLDKDNQKIPIDPLEGTGEITFKLPPGNYDLKLFFSDTPERVLANIIAIIGILVILVFIFGFQSENFKQT